MLHSISSSPLRVPHLEYLLFISYSISVHLLNYLRQIANQAQSIDTISIEKECHLL